MSSKAVVKYEDKKNDVAVKDFGGVNTQASRTAISENEFSWLENIIPIGYANAPVVPHQGSAVANIPGVTINYWRYANINNTDYLFCFTSAGGGYQVNLSTFVVTLIAAPAFFTGTVACAQWKNERLLIVAANGYWDWDGATMTSRGGTTSAPSAGADIATFAGRVWIAIGRTVSFSAPDSFTDFQTASAGGSFIITDETLQSNIQHLLTANNFLYIFGASSINVISDVRVATGAVTLFSNTNVSALIGTSLDKTIFPYYRTIGFATRYGIYALVGATPQKISDKLDGFFKNIDFSQTCSGGVALLYNLLCMAFMFQYTDSSGTRPIIAMLINKKWFFASQGNSLTLIAGVFQSGVPALFGTDGTNIYKLFSNTTNNINSTMQTALWPMGVPTRNKQTLKAGVELTVAAITTSLNIQVDTDGSSVAQSISATNTGEWFNATNVLGQWVNALAVTGDWIGTGFQIYQGDADSQGRYVGYTITSSDPGFSVQGLLMQHEVRANWAPRV